MSIAAKFRQEEFRGVFVGMCLCVFANSQIYLPFLCKCQRGFETPSLQFYF